LLARQSGEGGFSLPFFFNFAMMEVTVGMISLLPFCLTLTFCMTDTWNVSMRSGT
jgi:hypothetical protein